MNVSRYALQEGDPLQQRKPRGASVTVPQKPRGFQISAFQRGALYLSSSVLFLSGVAWLVAYYCLGLQTDYGVVPSPYELWSLQVHGAAAPLFLLVLGALFPTHISRAFKAGVNILTGVSLLLLIIVLIISGYLLYYCGDESFRSASSIIHSSIGLIAGPLLIFHIIRGRRLFPRERA